MSTEWEQIRTTKFSSESGPPDWPSEVRPVSIDGLALIGINPATNDLYWDGRQVEMRKRLETYERVLATIGAISAVALAVVEIGRAASVWP